MSAEGLSSADCEALLTWPDLDSLCDAAAQLRDLGHGNCISFSKKVFVPLTHLCRDICHYCVFAQPPRPGEAAYLSREVVLARVQQAAAVGCREVLFTLGDQPERRYQIARAELAGLGHQTTLGYLREVAQLVLDETGLLPHLNPGLLDAAAFAELRPVSASMGIMLESTSERLLDKGQAHYGCPDKVPSRRLETLRLAGEASVPFTSGLLIGIGETRRERLETLLALRALHRQHGHLQEVIVQNFRAKPDTRMADWPEPSLEDLLWTIAVARLVLGAEMNVQAPPNLSPGALPLLVAAGLNDWGGVSPVTPDFVNPEAPWPHLDDLAAETRRAGKELVERLTIYPAYALDPERWVDEQVRPYVLRWQDASGYARSESWRSGEKGSLPQRELELLRNRSTGASSSSPKIEEWLARATAGDELTPGAIVKLFGCRGDDFARVCDAADRLRQEVNGDTVSYVVNRNINYTNLCYFRCQFCAFSKGKLSENLRGQPYDLELEEIQRRASEAWQRGATEVCMQGGIHPDYSGQTYLDICRAVKAVCPEMHIHAFSPLEVWQGASTLGLPLEAFLIQLKDAGLDTLPGTAAEILDDSVRQHLCPDKIRTEQWLEVMRTAHGVGFRTTATVMFGHIDRPIHWAHHLLHLRHLQAETGGFQELVPLPFVGREAPIYRKGKARPGPTFREAVLMHAIARLVLHPHFRNIQTSWVKMGEEGAVACLNAGANDLGGTLMNESITRAAGAEHGEELPPERMEALIQGIGRTPLQRTTAYGQPSEERQLAARAAAPLLPVVNRAAGRRLRSNRPLVRPGLDG